jgi:hypothetical protein
LGILKRNIQIQAGLSRARLEISSSIYNFNPTAESFDPIWHGDREYNLGGIFFFKGLFLCKFSIL